MNVAKLELSKELYELSGWYDTTYSHTDKGAVKLQDGVCADAEICPAYDTDYLLKALPDRTKWLRYNEDNELWYVAIKIRPDEISAPTLEDAMCKLAIELFKQGVLNKENI